MARKNAVMKFVVPTALALGKRAVTRWPLFAAALGGAVVYGLWSRRGARMFGARTIATWTAKDAKPKTASVETVETPVTESPMNTSREDPWSPTAPNAAW